MTTGKIYKTFYNVGKQTTDKYLLDSENVETEQIDASVARTFSEVSFSDSESEMYCSSLSLPLIDLSEHNLSDYSPKKLGEELNNFSDTPKENDQVFENVCSVTSFSLAFSLLSIAW